MKRKKPSFNETYYGFRSFWHLLEDAQRRGIVTLRRDQKSGSYIIEDLGAAAAAKTDATGAAEPAVERKAEAAGRGRGRERRAHAAATAWARRPRPAHRRAGSTGNVARGRLFRGGRRGRRRRGRHRGLPERRGCGSFARADRAP